MKNYDYWKKSQITDISTFCYWLHQKGVGIYGSVDEKQPNKMWKWESAITWANRVITKLPNSEQSYIGKVNTHKYINRQNQSITGKLWKP